MTAKRRFLLLAMANVYKTQAKLPQEEN